MTRPDADGLSGSASVHVDAAKQEDEGERSDLPTCRNGHEFEFVASACGYGGDDETESSCW